MKVVLNYLRDMFAQAVGRPDWMDLRPYERYNVQADALEVSNEVPLAPNDMGAQAVVLDIKSPDHATMSVVFAYGHDHKRDAYAQHLEDVFGAGDYGEIECYEADGRGPVLSVYDVSPHAFLDVLKQDDLTTDLGAEHAMALLADSKRRHYAGVPQAREVSEPLMAFA